jgi:hypothetical protein
MARNDHHFLPFLFLPFLQLDPHPGIQREK